MNPADGAAGNRDEQERPDRRRPERCALRNRRSAADQIGLTGHAGQQHPEHQQQADTLRATVDLAKRTLTAAQPSRAPLPPMPDLGRTGRGSFIQWLLWPAFATICLLMGWTLGNLQSQGLSRQPVIATAPAQPTVQRAASVRLASGEGARPSGDFWSGQRWAERFQRHRETEGTVRRIEWQAPFVPKIEGRTEQET